MNWYVITECLFQFMANTSGNSARRGYGRKRRRKRDWEMRRAGNNDEAVGCLALNDRLGRGEEDNENLSYYSLSPFI